MFTRHAPPYAVTATRLSVLTIITLGVLVPASQAGATALGKGGFVSLELQVTSIYRAFGLVLGLAGGYQTAGGAAVGVALYDLLNGTPLPEQSDDGRERRRTKMHYGGLLFAKEIGSDGDLGPRVGAVVGIGDVSLYPTAKNRSSDGSVYFVVQPMVSFAARRSHTTQPGLSLGYRLHRGVGTTGVTDATLGGPFLGLSGALATLGSD